MIKWETVLQSLSSNHINDRQPVYPNNNKNNTIAYDCIQNNPPNPLCDLYFNGFSSSFDDIMDVYQKDEDYRKSRVPKDDEYGYLGYAEHSDEDADDADDADDAEEHSDEDKESDKIELDLEKEKEKEENITTDREHFDQKDSLSRSQHVKWIDLVLYVVSGLILIFIFESFIKLGTAM